MAVKKPFSYRDFEGVNPTARLFEKLFRDAVDYTKDIDNVFDAIVLTEPTLATPDANSALRHYATPVEDEDSNPSTNYIFIARLLGPDSPHNFLPDPSDFYVTDDDDCKVRYHNLLQLHTKVSANGLSFLDIPSVGDKIQLRLSKGEFIFNTQICRDYIGIGERATASSQIKEKLKKNNKSASAAFKDPKVKSNNNLQYLKNTPNPPESDLQISFKAAMRNEFPSIKFNDSSRPPERQAYYLLTFPMTEVYKNYKRNASGAVKIREKYNEASTEPEKKQLVDEMVAYFSSGGKGANFGHVGGKSVDVRTRGVGMDTITKYIKKAKELGATTWLEPSTCWVSQGGTNAQKKSNGNCKNEHLHLNISGYSASNAVADASEDTGQ